MDPEATDSDGPAPENSQGVSPENGTSYSLGADAKGGLTDVATSLLQLTADGAGAGYLGVPLIGKRKACTRCGEAKPSTKDYFYADSSSRDGLKTKCKVCCQTARAKRKYGVDEVLKVCTECGEAKPATSECFYADSSSKDGLKTKCKVCCQAADALRRARISATGLKADPDLGRPYRAAPYANGFRAGGSGGGTPSYGIGTDGRRRCFSPETQGWKLCGKCRLELPLTDFNKDSYSQDGRRSSCRHCQRIGDSLRPRGQPGAAYNSAQPNLHTSLLGAAHQNQLSSRLRTSVLDVAATSIPPAPGSGAAATLARLRLIAAGAASGSPTYLPGGLGLGLLREPRPHLRTSFRSRSSDFGDGEAGWGAAAGANGGGGGFHPASDSDGESGSRSQGVSQDQQGAADRADIAQHAQRGVSRTASEDGQLSRQPNGKAEAVAMAPSAPGAGDGTPNGPHANGGAASQLSGSSGEAGHAAGSGGEDGTSGEEGSGGAGGRDTSNGFLKRNDGAPLRRKRSNAAAAAAAAHTASEAADSAAWAAVFAGKDSTGGARATVLLDLIDLAFPEADQNATMAHWLSSLGAERLELVWAAVQRMLEKNDRQRLSMYLGICMREHLKSLLA